MEQDKVNTADSAFIFLINSKSKSMVRLIRAEKMVLSGLVFARKIARMILIQNIQGFMGPLMGLTHGRTVESRAVFSLS